MFLGLFVFASAAILLTILAVKALKRIARLFTGDKAENKGKDEKPSKGKKQDASKTEEKTRVQAEEKGPDIQQEQPSEELRQRYAGALFLGITESFYTGETPFVIDSKTLADDCVNTSSITYLEFNNRLLAGDDYFGFNLVVEEGERMILTYNGQALASITKIETEATAIINGTEVKGTAPGYRINTYPPHLSEGMAPSDVERMLEATDHIKGLPGNPMLVAQAMTEFFTHPENISKLKGAVDRKIQSRESVRKNKEVSAKQSSSRAKRLK